MRGWWQDLTDLVLPAECGGCGRPRAVLCPECRAELTGAPPGRVRPVPEPSGLPVVYAAAPYEDAVRATLLAHKERGALALAEPLGMALAGAVRAGLDETWGEMRWGRGGGGGGAPEEEHVLEEEPVLLVPVPSARRAIRARGHDPARRIALAAAGVLRRAGVSARVAGVLRQRRAVADQSGLDSRQRVDNLAGALEVVAGGARLLGGGRVVLVDDLMTTGASLSEAARAVRAARAGCAISGASAAGRAARGPGARPVAGDSAVRSAVTRPEARSSPRPAVRASGVGRTAEEVVRTFGVRGMAGVEGARDGICAAVVAAPPDSFRINRN
ncbi:ComF family protein [Streptomyces tailanensis]|uniref:ComF family protein n=1 Tax=Streptomyces tailanensis TaxID=2569858 RepID=UPI00122E8842|nr:phosphoribosyltransferase family protein [Streptomyces tailanensis]